MRAFVAALTKSVLCSEGGEGAEGVRAEREEAVAAFAAAATAALAISSRIPLLVIVRSRGLAATP